MNISQILKRVTGDVRYIIITLVLGLAILLDVFGLIEMISYSVNFVALILSLSTLIADICLLLYALGYHGTGKSKITLYMYFLLHIALIIFSGVVGISLKYNAIITVLIAVVMMAFAFFGIRGLPVFLATGAVAVYYGISVVRIIASIGSFFGLLPFLSLIMPPLVIIIAGYLIATDKK